MNDNFSTMNSEIGQANNYAGWIVDVFKPFIGSRLLEIGIGYDNYRPLLPPVETHWAVDIDPSAIQKAEKENPKGNYLCGNISDPAIVGQLHNQLFDTILCINVLEHIEEESDFLSNMMKIMQPNGHLLLFVPAFPGLYCELDRLAGHHRRYTIQSMRHALTDKNGEIIKLHYFNPIGALGWWINTFFSHSNLDSQSINTQVKLFDRYIVPISKVLDKLTKHWVGQSLVCIVKKSSKL